MKSPHHPSLCDITVEGIIHTLLGLIRSERKGVELHNTSRCEELKKQFGNMIVAIIDAYSEQNKR